MAVFKPKKDDPTHTDKVSITDDLHDFLVKAAEAQLTEELSFITFECLKETVRQYVVERNLKETIEVPPENPVRLSLFLQNLFFYEEHAVAELHVALPIVAKSSDHDEIWRRLLTGNFPNHGLRDGCLCVFVEFPAADMPQEVNGVYHRKEELS
jgi:hypothetical protein